MVPLGNQRLKYSDLGVKRRFPTETVGAFYQSICGEYVIRHFASYGDFPTCYADEYRGGLSRA
jgi:hypothetical protein